MRRHLSLLLLLAVSACSGSSAGGGTTPASPSTSDPGSPQGAGLTASIAIADAAGATGPFALRRVDRLSIAVSATGLPAGTHALRLDVVSPHGVLYTQVLRELVAGEDGAASAGAFLQVRGTNIRAFRQAGTWQVNAFVDGTPLASAAVDLTE